MALLIPAHEINIRPVLKGAEPRLLAYADFTLGPFRVHGTEIVRDDAGKVSIRFANRPVPVACSECKRTIGLSHAFCHFCGAHQPQRDAPRNANGAPRLSREFIHPMNEEDRSAIQSLILGAYLVAIGIGPRLAVLPESA